MHIVFIHSSPILGKIAPALADTGVLAPHPCSWLTGPHPPLNLPLEQPLIQGRVGVLPGDELPPGWDLGLEASSAASHIKNFLMVQNLDLSHLPLDFSPDLLQ